MEPIFWPDLRFRGIELKALQFLAKSLLSAFRCLLNMKNNGDYDLLIPNSRNGVKMNTVLLSTFSLLFKYM